MSANCPTCGAEVESVFDHVDGCPDTDADFLRGLAERLMAVPAQYGTDQADCDRLLEIAHKL